LAFPAKENAEHVGSGNVDAAPKEVEGKQHYDEQRENSQCCGGTDVKVVFDGNNGN
jgi:hypothetical protein